MKLPEKIIGRNRVRDASIIYLWDTEDLTPLQLSEKFKLTQRRIQQILRTNHAFVPIDKAWEKKKRIAILKSFIKNKPTSQKDVADLLEQLRGEIEGKDTLIQVNTYTQIWNRTAEKTKEVDALGRVHIRNKTEVPA